MESDEEISENDYITSHKSCEETTQNGERIKHGIDICVHDSRCCRNGDICYHVQ